MSNTPKSDATPETLENGVAAAGDAGQTAQEQQPSLRILGQYLKDLSFENPNAPQSLSQESPEISVSVNVNARPLGPTDFEVELHLEDKAMAKDKVDFAMAHGAHAGVVYPAGPFDKDGKKAAPKGTADRDDAKVIARPRDDLHRREQR